MATSGRKKAVAVKSTTTYKKSLGRRQLIRNVGAAGATSALAPAALAATSSQLAQGAAPRENNEGRLLEAHQLRDKIKRDLIKTQVDLRRAGSNRVHEWTSGYIRDAMDKPEKDQGLWVLEFRLKPQFDSPGIRPGDSCSCGCGCGCAA